MKLFSIVIFVLFGLIISSCEKRTINDQNCDSSFPFSNVEWEVSNTIPDECRWMLRKILYKGGIYYTVGNHCVDMAAFVATCDGVNICDTQPIRCNRILNNGIQLGLVAVERD